LLKLSNMIRIGRIAHVQEGVQGIIIDENEQEIPFVLDESTDVLSVGVKVQFRIEAKSKGLVAVGVRPIDL